MEKICHVKNSHNCSRRANIVEKEGVVHMEVKVLIYCFELIIHIFYAVVDIGFCSGWEGKSGHKAPVKIFPQGGDRSSQGGGTGAQRKKKIE